MAPRPGEGSRDVNSGPRRARAIDISSTDDDIGGVANVLYIGGAGNVVVVMADQPDASAVTLTGLAVGVWHRMQYQKIIRTSTTATSIVAGFN